MANAVAVDTWSGHGVRLSEVVDALHDLRNQSTDRSSAVRTAVMTLVAVARTDEQAYAATNALRTLGSQHPARIVLVRPDPDQVATLDARATLYNIEGGPHALNFEEVTLTVGGQAANHLDSVIEPFTLADLPVMVWYVGAVPDAADPLLTIASAVMIDSRDAADAGLLRTVLEIARKRTVVDLSWIRLEPWRELLATLFEPSATRPWITAIASVEVSGKIGPRQLLGGWLASRLDLHPHQIEMVDARHVEIRVACRRDGQSATFDVKRGDVERTVVAEGVLPGGATDRHHIGLADDPLATSLAQALTHLEPDVVWEKALSSATAIAAS